jgi:adenylosuccinate lyase
MQRLAADPAFANISLSSVLDPLSFVGRAPEQVDDFVNEVVKPLLEQHQTQSELDAQVFV